MSKEINGKVTFTGTGGEKDLHLTGAMVVEDDKLNGVILGEIEKDGTGRIDNLRVDIRNLQFSGGGSGSGSDIMKVNFSIIGADPETHSAYFGTDKTISEIRDALVSGTIVIGVLVIVDPLSGDTVLSTHGIIYLGGNMGPGSSNTPIRVDFSDTYATYIYDYDEDHWKSVR